MEMMSNLLEDLVEEIFCKLPVTSLRAVRLTCKKWNTISKSQRFAEKHINKAKAAERELSVIMLIDHKVLLMGLHNINGIPSINRKAELVNLEIADQVEIYRVFHCDGLLLCITKEEKLVVWNPYWGQTRWITPIHSNLLPYYYVTGYEVMNNTRSHKILTSFGRYVNKYENVRSAAGYAIYDFKNNSWRNLVITAQDWNIDLCQPPGGVSLKGNTYWFGGPESSLNFLICFDFTRERFGARLSLPFSEANNVVLLLSSVREEQLAVLVVRCDTLEMEIWVTSEIKPTMASWSKFLTVKTRQFDYCPFESCIVVRCFFIEEENKVAVIVGKDKDRRRNMAYIFGVDGYLREVDLGESTDRLRLFPYVPSSVHIR